MLIATYSMPGTMDVADVAEAFQIVLDLARAEFESNKTTPEVRKQQLKALLIIEDIAVNEYGDD